MIFQVAQTIEPSALFHAMRDTELLPDAKYKKLNII